MEKKLMKLLTLLLLTVLLGFVIKSNEAKAATTDNGFEYVCDYYYNTATIYGYTGNESNIVFPSEIDGCKVTKILAPDDGWGKYYRLLDNYNTVVSIVIPDTVEEIGKEAFFRCINLKSVVMSKNLRKLGDEAFRECGSLETIVLPASIEELGELAFYYCTNLKTVTLPSKSKITLMPRAVFNNCSSLEQINIPNNVKKIDRSAFYGCSSLTSIDIPSSVIEIRSQAFDECTNLSEIKLNEGLEIIENMVFYNTAIKKMDIPSTVTELGSSAFAACENLSIVSCGSNLNVIGESVFKDCINLIEVELNEGLTLISKSSFQNTAITTIVIPSTVEKIESYAFKDCSSLKNAIFLGTPKMDGFTSGMRTTLYGYKNSVVQGYAKKIGMRFVAIEKPTGLKAANSDYKYVKLTWNAVEGDNKYNIYRSTSKNGAYQKLDTITKISYKDDSIIPGKTYYYYVTLEYENEDGVVIRGVKSDIASVKLAPKNITGFTADYQYKTKKVNLTWDKSSDATGYVVYYRNKTSDKWTKVKGISSNKTISYTHKLKNNFSVREYAIRAYKTVNGKNVYSNYKTIIVGR